MLSFKCRCRSTCAATLILSLFLLTVPARATVYVNASNAGAVHDGTSWANAYLTVQEGINSAAASSDEVWIAAGKYVQNLTISAPVKLYGGFAGTETQRSARDYRARVTILDGGKTERVINITGGAGAAVIDGFTITNGSTGEHGGALRLQDCSPIVRNNIITGNYAGSVGGSMYILRGSPTITGNIITANNSNEGGAIFTDSSTARIANNVIARNLSRNGDRVIFLYRGTYNFIGNTVIDNYGNGAVTTYDSTSVITNNIVAWNTGGIRNERGAMATVNNNCTWQNRGYDYAGYDPIPDATTGNITADPLLLRDNLGAARPKLASPCINAGADSVVLEGETDVDGQNRKNGTVDIGADESYGIAPVQATIYVKTTGDDAKDGSSWANAKLTIAGGMSAAYATGAEVWVAAGTYKESIDLVLGIAVYGGFAGNETVRTQRNWRTNATTIDAEAKSNVVRAGGTITMSTVLDGFVLVNGSTSEHGGGIRTQDAAPVIRNNIIKNCYAGSVGGGAYLLRGAPWFIGNVIINNNAHEGGAIFTDGAGARLSSNVFARNYCRSGNRIIFLYRGTYNFIGNTVIDNYGNGAVTTYDSNCVISNNIVAWNTGGIRNERGAMATANNNCTWQNRGYDYTGFDPVPGATTGNITADPLILRDSFGSAHLQAGSPCLNAALDAAFIAGETDVDGQDRKFGAAVDIGADESTGTTPTQSVIYVKTTGDDAKDGSSWANAKLTITAGMAAAYATGAEVWVAAGTYKESIDLVHGVAVYGGFVGNETVRTQRNWRTNTTTIDAESKSNVVRAGGTITLSTVLDGFVLMNGNTNEHGGGIRSVDAAPLIRNNIIRNCYASSYGGGVYALRGAPVITGNVISNNNSHEASGIWIESSGVGRVTSNIIARNYCRNGNRVNFLYGGAVEFIGNTVIDNYGNGAVTTYDTTSIVTNNIVAWNTGGIRNERGAMPTVKNNCVWQNRSYNYTGFDPVPEGTDGNFSADPLIVRDAYGVAHLQLASPCINAGLDSAVVSGETDVDSQARKNGTVDIGADETYGTAPNQATIYVKTTGDDAKDGGTWANAKKTITAGMTAAFTTGADVWVAAGTYKESLDLVQGVAVYGGFAGTETARAQRNWRTNVTTIDAEAKSNVVRAGGTITLSSVLDGFVLVNGSTGEHGGGIRTVDAAPLIRNNVIKSCYAAGNGGGFYSLRGAPWYIGNVFLNNSGNEGGILWIESTEPSRLVSNVFARNRSRNMNRTGFLNGGTVDVIGNSFVGNYGSGAVTSNYCTSRIIGNIIAFNTHGLRLEQGSTDARYNNLYGNTAYDHTGFPANIIGQNGNISAEPMLVEDAVGVLHLQPGSPCINAGLDTVMVAADTDIDNQARKNGAAVDIGADEADGTTWSPSVFYVKPTGDDTKSGATWALAKKTIPAAIAAAALSNGEVWVAAGTYMQNVKLAPTVAIYGGFVGTETARSQRNWKTNETIVDGNKNGPVVYADGDVTRRAVFDGFTITNGYAADHGGGVRTDSYGSPTIRNNRIIKNNAPNWGGGVFLSTNGGAWILNNVIANNTSGERGGGVAANGAYYARIAGNVVSRNRGTTGGIDCQASSPYVVNNTITDNIGDGALMLWDSPGRAWNNIIAFNSAGARTNNSAANLLFRNNLVYGNVGYNYSGMADPAGAGGNLSAMPLLLTDARGVIHYGTGSPGINAGLNNAVLPVEMDIDGQARILNGTVDIGADEYDGAASVRPIIYVKPSGNDTNNGSTWALAKRTLQGGIDAAYLTGAEIWAAVGPYRENIVLSSGVALYGGFKGTETQRSQRNTITNETVIDGGGVARVITAPYAATSSTLVDGFTITNGRADWGAGIRCDDSGAVFQNCLITANTATGGAGGAYVLRGGPSFLNCVFSDNVAPNTGALYFESCGTGRAENCLFVRNKANNSNGAVVVLAGNSAVINCTIADNTGDSALVVWDCVGKTINNIIAYNSYGFRTNAADPVLRNNCVSQNLGYDWWPSNWDFTGVDGNTTQNPVFRDRANSDYHLAAASPCVDKGESGVITPGLTDLDGFSRVEHGAIDLGCYELGLTVIPTRYVFLSSPITAVAGTAFPRQPVVAAVDSAGRVAGNYTGTVTLSIKTGTGTPGAVLSGTTVLQFNGGVAYYAGLSIDKSGRNYVLRATGTLTAAECTPFDVSPSAPRLVFSTQPLGATRGVLFRQQPVVRVADDAGALTSYTGPVTLTIKSGTGASGALLNGARTVNAVAGVATFTGLSIDTIGAGYILTATSGTLPPVDSAVFDVTPPGEVIAFDVQPGGAVAAKPFIMQPTLRVTSKDGLPATDYTGSVTLAIKAGSGTSGAILGGVKTVNFVNGVARFSGLTIDKVGLRYVLTATSSTMGAESDPMRVVATTPDLLTRTWTANADFDEGVYSLTNHTPTNDQLNLISYQTKPYIWVPNISGSASKVDVVTGNEVARYRTGPYYTYPNPSRTTVDLRGNCFVGNRRIGTLVKIGQEETGDWIDRNGNGVCDTSRDLNGDGDITGSEELAWNQDECVLFEVSLIPGREGTYQPGQFTQYVNDDSNPGIRSLAIDASNNLWAAGYNTGNAAARKFYYIDGTTGQILNVVDYSSTGHTAYGAVTDSNGVIWSSGQGYNNILRFDPTTSPISYRRIELPHNPYGVGVDGLNHVFVSGWTSNKISRLNTLTGDIEKTIDAPTQLRGIVCSADNDVWTVSTSDGKLYRYDNDLTTQKAAIPVGDQPTGCAVDKNGKIWACMLGGTDATIVRVDPTTNTVELTKPIKGSSGHYSYSDMTGGVSTAVTARRGTWTVLFDGGDLNRPWGKVSWTQNLPAGTMVTVRVQSSNDKKTWTAFEASTNGADLSATTPGRYLKVEVTFATTTVGTTPVLLDLTAQALARPVYTANDAANALKIAAGLNVASPADFAKLNITTSGLPEKVTIEDAIRILRFINSGQ